MPTALKDKELFSSLLVLVKLSSGQVTQDIHTKDMNYFLVVSFGQVEFWSSDTRRTESDAYEPTVHKHRCAQKFAISVRVRPHIILGLHT